MDGHGNLLPEKGLSAVQGEDNDPGAQTGRPGAVGLVRGLLGGTSSPAVLFRGLTPPRTRRGQDGRYRPSTSFQKSAAGLSLIRSRVGSERRTSASRSRWKSQKSSFSRIPFNGDRSVTGEPDSVRTVKGMPASGDRSETCVLMRLNLVRGMPLSGDRSEM